MIITVTSLRAGVGRTATSIGLANRLSVSLDEAINIVDLNQNEMINYYLNETQLVRSLDNYIANAELITDYSTFLRKCAKKVDEKFFMTSSNVRHELNDDLVSGYVEFCRQAFLHTVIDANVGIEGESNASFFDISDYIIVLLEQDYYSLRLLNKLQNQFKPYERKLIFVVNKYVEEIEGTTIDFNSVKVRTEIRQAGLDSPFYVVPVSAMLRNSTNLAGKRRILEVTGKKGDIDYCEQLDNILHYALGGEASA